MEIKKSPNEKFGPSSNMKLWSDDLTKCLIEIDINDVLDDYYSVRQQLQAIAIGYVSMD